MVTSGDQLAMHYLLNALRHPKYVFTVMTITMRVYPMDEEDSILEISLISKLSGILATCYHDNHNEFEV